MFRYLALIWNDGSDEQRRAAHLLAQRLRGISDDWQVALDTPGLRVYCCGPRPGGCEIYPMHNGAGVVVGTLFKRREESPLGSAPRRVSLAEGDTARIVDSKGRELIASYWGCYVAFAVDPTIEAKWVLKDPTGNLPCYHTSFAGVTVVFSTVADCLALGLMRFTVNWDYVVGYVAFGGFQGGSTGLTEVSEVCSGQRLEVRDSECSTSSYWDPFTIARQEPIEDTADAVALLRSTTRQCIHAWASHYGSILHRLSGGFDSAVVLGCLADAPSEPTITCLTYYIPGEHSNVRSFARLAAARLANCEHVEQPRNAAKIDFTELLSTAPSVNPTFDFAFLEIGRIETALARDRQLNAIFSGEGGDPLFGRYARSEMIADYLYHHGMRWKLVSLSARLAPALNTTIWHLLADAMTKRLTRQSWNVMDRLLPNRTLVSAAVLSDVASRMELLHPWLQDTSGVARGTALTASALTIPRQFYDPRMHPRDEAPQSAGVLYSQPIVEVCLRIPSYVHGVDGRDRGLARRAFASDLPLEIASRQWKDRGPGSAESAFMANLKFTRELLLDGILVQRGLLDRHRLETVLSASPTTGKSFGAEALEYLIPEAWLQSWTNLAQRAAA